MKTRFAGGDSPGGNFNATVPDKAREGAAFCFFTRLCCVPFSDCLSPNSSELFFAEKRAGLLPPLRLSKSPGVDEGPQPLMFHPALTTSASERMKPRRFSYLAGFSAREPMREAKPVKTRKSGVPPLFRHSEGRDCSRPFRVSDVCVRQLSLPNTL